MLIASACWTFTTHTPSFQTRTHNTPIAVFKPDWRRWLLIFFRVIPAFDIVAQVICFIRSVFHSITSLFLCAVSMFFFLEDRGRRRRCFIRSDLFANLNLSFLDVVQRHSSDRTTNRRQDWQLRSQMQHHHQLLLLLLMLNLPLHPDNPIIQSNFLPRFPSSSARGAQNERKEGRTGERTDGRKNQRTDWRMDKGQEGWTRTGGGLEGGWTRGSPLSPAWCRLIYVWSGSLVRCPEHFVIWTFEASVDLSSLGVLGGGGGWWWQREDSLLLWAVHSTERILRAYHLNVTSANRRKISTGDL